MYKSAMFLETGPPIGGPASFAIWFVIKWLIHCHFDRTIVSGEIIKRKVHLWSRIGRFRVEPGIVFLWSLDYARDDKKRPSLLSAFTLSRLRSRWQERRLFMIHPRVPSLLSAFTLPRLRSGWQGGHFLCFQYSPCLDYASLQSGWQERRCSLYNPLSFRPKDSEWRNHKKEKFIHD